jgi:hypothetical protein
MECDYDLYTCTISMGSIVLVFVLVATGASICLYDIIDGLMEWWSNRPKK